jgi:hypothetical protein
MRATAVVAALAGAALLSAPLAALAEDNEAGVPLSPAEAAGAWTVSTGGHDVCQITMTAGHGVKTPAACADVFPDAPTAWQATRDGVQLIGAGGAIGFARWSNSLFVSRRASHTDVQLRRGGPVPPAD